uniref:Uncharacterized protein n=1 Tax=viral metagenome TaxID=1070528 RepID=A0A6C0KXZ6_9ZZZZ
MCFFDLCCKKIDNKKIDYSELDAISQQFRIIQNNSNAKLGALQEKYKRPNETTHRSRIIKK